MIIFWYTCKGIIIHSCMFGLGKWRKKNWLMKWSVFLLTFDALWLFYCFIKLCQYVNNYYTVHHLSYF